MAYSGDSSYVDGRHKEREEQVARKGKIIATKEGNNSKKRAPNELQLLYD